jgi:hypothetical protein
VSLILAKEKSPRISHKPLGLLWASSAKVSDAFLIIHVHSRSFADDFTGYATALEISFDIRAPLETPFTRQKKMIKYKHETERIF